VLTRHAITRRADADGVDAAIVERDYILAHVVAQLHRATPKDGGTLIFKGGTALRFIHIGDYRYSADLDFTVIKEMWDRRLRHFGDVLEAARQHAALPYLELTDDDANRSQLVPGLIRGPHRTVQAPMEQ
jgi:predicted nucleotidyltransferase component of viral defense system